MVSSAGEQQVDPGFRAREIASVLVAEVQDYAILMLDANGRVASWNPGAGRIMGYHAHEIIGCEFSVFHPPEARAAGHADRLMASARTTGRVEEAGWRVRKDGRRFWANVVITALLDETGEIRGYGHVTRDLTERHVAEERFRAAFLHAPIGISISDLQHGREGRFIEVNSALARMLGYEVHELVGAMVLTVTHQEDREAPTHLLRQLLAGNSVSVEMQLIHREGHEIWTLVSSTPLPEPPGHAPRAAISQILDISERKRFESKLRYLADHDTLTGLFNRHRFGVELDGVIADVAHSGRGAALLMIDLDGFKEVNDQFGHPVGDELVSRIAAVLRNVVRAPGTIARLGGDEFAVVLPHATLHDAESAASRLLTAIRNHGPMSIGGRRARITASVGVTTFDPTTALNGSQLVVEADSAMYEAKSRGRDRYVVYDRNAPRGRLIKSGAS